MESYTEECKKRAVFLYGFLSGLLRGRLLNMLKGIDDGNGYEAVRNLFMTLAPSTKVRTLAILNTIMSWPTFKMGEGLLAQCCSWKRCFGSMSGLQVVLMRS